MALAAVVARPTDEDTGDRELVERVRAGDDRAFEQLYVRYQRAVAAYVRGMVHDHGRAEDITQEVFISALCRMRETDREIAFKPWVFEIAKNACIDAFRRSRHRHEVSFDAQDALGGGDHDRLAGMGATPDAAIDAKLDLDNLRGAFGGLSEVHHQILVMRELDGLSYRDIGERLGMSRPAVESTLFRARRRLGEEYDELVSGRRCLRVRAIVDAGDQSAGVRDRRRMNRHLSHCRPCRRYARLSGLAVDARPALRPAAAKIAALLPLPAIARRRVVQDADQLLGAPGHATLARWSANVAGGLDPGALAGWSKAVAAAATVAVAGVGAGAAITEREALHDFVSRATALAGVGGSAQPARDGAGVRSPALRDAQRPPAGGGSIRLRTAGGDGRKLGGRRGGSSREPPHAHAGGARRPQADPLERVDELVKRALERSDSRHGSVLPVAKVSGTVAGATHMVDDVSGSVRRSVAGVQGTAASTLSSSSGSAAGLVDRVAPTVRTTVAALPLGG